MGDIKSKRIADFQSIVSSANFLISVGQPDVALKVLEAAIHRIALEKSISDYSETESDSIEETELLLVTGYNEAAILAGDKRRKIKELLLKVSLTSLIITTFVVFAVGVILKMVESTFKAQVGQMIGVVNEQVIETARAFRSELPRGTDKLVHTLDQHMERALDRKIETIIEKKLSATSGENRKKLVIPENTKRP